MNLVGHGLPSGVLRGSWNVPARRLWCDITIAFPSLSALSSAASSWTTLPEAVIVGYPFVGIWGPTGVDFLSCGFLGVPLFASG